MKSLRRALKILGLVGCGALIGAVVCGMMWHKTMSSISSTALLEIAVDARLLQQGQADLVLERKASALPRLVQQLDSVDRRYLSEETYNITLWVVQRYYEECDTEVPAAIKPILDALPPEPPRICELKRQPQGKEPETPEPDVVPSKAAPEPQTSDLDKAVSIAIAKSADARKPGGEFKLIGAQQIFLDGKYVWRITFKPVRLLPDDPSTGEIGAGGEVFVNVDIKTEEAIVLYGE